MAARPCRPDGGVVLVSNEDACQSKREVAYEEHEAVKNQPLGSGQRGWDDWGDWGVFSDHRKSFWGKGIS